MYNIWHIAIDKVKCRPARNKHALMFLNSAEERAHNAFPRVWRRYALRWWRFVNYSAGAGSTGAGTATAAAGAGAAAGAAGEGPAPEP